MGKRQLLLTIVLVILLAGCKNDAEDEVIMLSDPPTPEQVVRGFYNTYLEYAANGELDIYFKDRIYQEYFYLSQEFINYLESLRDQAGSWSYDPVLCSADIPERLEPIGAELNNDEIILNMISNMENHSFDIYLSPREQHYEIRKINCK